MDTLIISESFIVKEAISCLFRSMFSSSYIEATKNINTVEEKLKSFDLIFIDINEDKMKEVEVATKYKKINNKLKIIVLDLLENEKLCNKAIKLNIDGYITDLEDNDEFEYILHKIMLGKKYYDASIIQKTLISKNLNTNDALTNRENEVMAQVAKGLNNREIAKNLSVTEFTIKKHLSSIFNKLNLKNRQDIIIRYKDGSIN